MADYSSSSSTDNKQKQQPQVLPKGWIRTFSNSQQRYYYSHKDTKHTQWHFPTASEAADPWMAQRRAQENQEKEKKRSTTISSTTASGASTTPASTTAHPPPSSKRPRTEESATTTATTTATKPTSAAPPNSNSNTININPLDALLALADTTNNNVAIIVPYRDLHVEQHRAKHLQQFVPYMIQFMTRLVQQQKVSDFHIYIIEQSNDGRKFNRGKLLNIGFDLAKKNNNKRGNNGKSKGNNGNAKQHDVFIFHDVDLLPQPPLSDAYATFPKTPYHIARVWDRYSNNPKYFGGIVAFSASDFKRINGYPNTFWGWGGEDDELQLRCQALGLVWDWPRTNIKQQNAQQQSQKQQNQQQLLIQDLEDMTLQDKLQFLRQHKEWKCMVKWEALEEHEQTWKINGLADLQYTVLHTEALDSYSGSSSSSSSSSGSSKATKITVNVQLNPNHHWANDKCSVDYMGG